MAHLDHTKIGFIGFGNMASALADGFIASGKVPAEHLYACAGHFDALKTRAEARGMHAVGDAAALVDAADLVVIAIKPVMIERVLAPLAGALANKPMISVAAAWDCAAYENLLPGTRHLSTVPNTPVSIGEGVIACEREHTLTAGTAKLQLATGAHPGAMKDAVCSPGGTTIKGLAELEACGLRSAFIRAIDAIEG